MSALGHKQTFSQVMFYVRSASESGRREILLFPRSRTLLNLRPTLPHADCAADRLLLGEGSGAGAERGTRSHRPIGPETTHELTFKLDQSVGAGQ